MMLMTATAASAAAASAAATAAASASGLSSDLARGRGKKIAVAISNSFYSVFFLPNSYKHTKFHTNRTKSSYWSAFLGWSGQSENSHVHFKLILYCF